MKVSEIKILNENKNLQERIKRVIILASPGDYRWFKEMEDERSYLRQEAKEFVLIFTAILKKRGN